MNRDDLLKKLKSQELEIRNLKWDLEEARERIKELNGMLDEVYDKADDAEHLIQCIVDLITI